MGTAGGVDQREGCGGGVGEKDKGAGEGRVSEEVVGQEGGEGVGFGWCVACSAWKWVGQQQHVGSRGELSST